MIAQNFEYVVPKDLNEALALIADGAKPLAGGMSLIPMMKLRLAIPDKLVDLGRLSGLSEIKEEGGSIRIGAMATHHALESSALLRAKCPLLPEAASMIGDVQVRNVGTVGGSIAHADPAADWPASFIALEAMIEIVSPSGSRKVKAEDFFVDTFTTAVEPGELVKEITVPVEASGVGTSYQKMIQPASGFAIVGIAARIQKSGGKITMARIGVTGLANKAYRAVNVETALTGTAGSEADIAKAAGLVAEGADANSDLHASADYRRHMAVVYTARAIRAALARTA
jgi:carbon-monoxide dehydrogenase medium subunit